MISLYSCPAGWTVTLAGLSCGTWANAHLKIPALYAVPEQENFLPTGSLFINI